MLQVELSVAWIEQSPEFGYVPTERRFGEYEQSALAPDGDAKCGECGHDAPVLEFGEPVEPLGEFEFKPHKDPLDNATWLAPEVQTTK